MADASHIEWTDATWNIITGCSVVSPGCTHCYAMRLAGTRMKHEPTREGLTIDTKAGPVWNGQVRFNANWLDQPLRWSKPRKIFVCAHGDLFHDGVTDEWLDQVFAVMTVATQHTFQILTKRADRMKAYVQSLRDQPRFLRLNEHEQVWAPYEGGVPKNIWLGVSVEDQTRADERIPALLDTPAAIRWISAEPLLGRVDLGGIQAPRYVDEDHDTDWKFDCLGTGDMYWYDCGDGFSETGDGPDRPHAIDWVVVGGESGTGARPMHVQWARQLRDQCAAADVPFLFKQWGAWAPVCAIDVNALNDRLYHPAPKRLGPEATRRPRTAQTVLHSNGDRFDDVAAWGAYQAGSGAMLHFEIGKSLAGRLLDGAAHDGYPEVT